MNRTHRSMIVPFCLLAACAGKAAAPPVSCDERRVELKRWADALAREPSLGVIPGDRFPVATLNGVSGVTARPITSIQVQKGQLSFEGDPLWTTADGREALRSKVEAPVRQSVERFRRMWTLTRGRGADTFQYPPADAAPPPPYELVFLIAPDARWGDVAEALTVATAAVDPPRGPAYLAFRRDVAVAPPRPSSADKEVAELEAQGFGDPADTSEDVRRVMRDRAHIELLEKRRGGCTLNDLATCPCSMDFDAIRTILWSLHRPDTGLFVEILVSPDATGTEVAAAADTPWSEMYTKVLAATGPVHLVVR